MSAQEGNGCANTDPHPQVTQECTSPKVLEMSDKGRLVVPGGSCVPSGKAVKGKALPDLLERETCYTASFPSFPSW